MGRKREVPITPAVLQWAISESGRDLKDVADQSKIRTRTLEAWLGGSDRPGLSELKAVARTLHRQLAVFLLPAPPKDTYLPVQFRHPLGANRDRALTPEERRFLRRAKRL